MNLTTIILKFKNIILYLILILFLLVSFFPTIFELSKAHNLYDKNREFILEHNYYWPDYNLYLSKIRQGWEGRWTAVERYTSEQHEGSLIQEFYVILGKIGKVSGLDPTFSYQLGRIILSPLLLLAVILLATYYFRQPLWQIIAFLTVLVSGSFPRIYMDGSTLKIGRFMEWWSNIDVVQRITFIPHIVFGQIGSFLILYFLLLRKNHLTRNQFVGFIMLGNLVGLTFPPSLITLDSVLILTILINFIKSSRFKTAKAGNRKLQINNLVYIFLTLPSLLYIFLITQITPWSTLIESHRIHPMLIPFWDYILGTGPIFFLGLLGALMAIFKKEKIWQPLIFWILTTFLFAIFFTHIIEQSPLRFTQTGLFIPLGLLGTYFFYALSKLINTKVTILILSLYILENIFMMKVSLDWQTTFITQRIGANVPLVPYPPQTMYPLKDWMDGIRWLRDHTDPEQVVLAEVTAGNFIPAYAGNTVYFGQSNTVNYDTKQLLADQFFQRDMNEDEAKSFLQKGNIQYIFFSIQEKDVAGGKDIDIFYPFMKIAFKNDLVTIYKL